MIKWMEKRGEDGRVKGERSVEITDWSWQMVLRLCTERKIFRRFTDIRLLR